MTEGLCLDAGAMIGLERGDDRVSGLVASIRERGGSLEVPAGVVAQVWRGGRQARIARFLGADHVTIVDLDAQTARAIGVLCGLTGLTDVVDGHVALHARRRNLGVVTSDPDDIAAFDSSLTIIAV